MPRNTRRKRSVSATTRRRRFNSKSKSKSTSRLIPMRRRRGEHTTNNHTIKRTKSRWVHYRSQRNKQTKIGGQPTDDDETNDVENFEMLRRNIVFQILWSKFRFIMYDRTFMSATIDSFIGHIMDMLYDKLTTKQKNRMCEFFKCGEKKKNNSLKV